MITIQKSTTADTRSCDYSKVTLEQLRQSSVQHIGDVNKGLMYFCDLLNWAAVRHDFDKLTDIQGFHRDFLTGFKETTWWDKHRKVNRHHLLAEDGIPENVNLIDVLELIADCVMAGMGRTGTVYPLNISPDVLMKAFHNTAELLKSQVIVAEQIDPAEYPCSECPIPRQAAGEPQECAGCAKMKAHVEAIAVRSGKATQRKDQTS